MSASATAEPLHLALVAAIREPHRVSGWSIALWELQIRLARRLRLLSRLAAAIDGRGLLPTVPPDPRRHLLSELELSRWRTNSMRWAVERVGGCLVGRGYSIVLLKGAAYLSQDLAISRGRLPSDLDVLVPREALGDAQDRLRADGWEEMELDAHDLRYYREWSHEVPPMRHPAHRIELDLHHNILPPVGRPHVRAELLLERIRPSPWTGWFVLSPADQFLHAAAHLFCDSLFRDRLRDLVDLDGLALDHGDSSQFWSDVALRALELGLVEQKTLACRFLVDWFGAPVPEAALPGRHVSGWTALRRKIVYGLMSSALRPDSPEAEATLLGRAVDTALLVRHHLHRLPLRLLVPHLIHKAGVKRRDASSGA